jgi:putative RNA 2'-phosphotransferase
MDNRHMVHISKFLSKYLRHAPEELGLTLAPGGWVEIDDLLAGCARKRFPITREELTEVVEKNDKQRFSFDESRTLIRANQGHSTEVDLKLIPQTPPDVLYHGTASHTLPVIRQHGLQRISRHHVHLSTTVSTAEKVGARHGQPVVLVVDAAAMHRAGILFYCSENGVWLVDAVPPEYLREQ